MHADRHSGNCSHCDMRAMLKTITKFFIFYLLIYVVCIYHFRAPLSVRCNNNMNAIGGPGSEYSLPPSYRPRNNLSRIPTVMAGTGTGHIGIGVGDTAANMLSNTNDSTCMTAITETRAIITSANQQHQQQQLKQQQKQQQLLQQNSIISDTALTSSSLPLSPASTLPINTVNNGHLNAILVTDDTTVNNMKISHICNVNDVNGIGGSGMAPKTPISDIDRIFMGGVTTTIDDKISVNSKESIVADIAEASNRTDLVTIVTISGCNNPTDGSGEMDILAHL